MLSTARRSTLRVALSSQSARSFFNVSLPVMGGPGGAHITKYHIVRPGKDGVEYDDFLLALPERAHLASFSKEVPLFIRYLKVVTDQEHRQAAFQAFYERTKSGLVVESDVYITSEELLALMWKNGYSEQERNAIQFTFPSDYKFHYPELAVLFNLAEEDTYKFCMRTRMEASHIGQLDAEKVKTKGLIRNHWVIFGTGIFIFKYFPFFNYYFGVKVFGTSMWCWTVWSLMNRFIAKACRRNEYMASQKTAQEVMDGEDRIVESMRRFANDAKCVESLKTFRGDAEAKIAAYKRASVLKMKDELSERAAKQLQAIAVFEASMGSAMQQTLVAETAASFKETYATDTAMQTKAFSAALKSLSGQQLGMGDDPVATHFAASLKSMEGVNLMTVKGDPKGTIAARIAYLQQAKEKEFQETFMVSANEAAQVRQLAAGGDISKLSADALAKLSALYTSINAKVGYALPEGLGTKPIVTSDAAAKPYVDAVNSQLEAASKELQIARLSVFAKSF